MDIFNVASALFGSSRVEETDGISNTVDSISAVGAIDSDSGNVGLTMDADITPADDVDGDETIFEVPTSPAVAAGDDVVMGLTGNGPLKVPIVLANPGSGDRMATAVQDAHDLAASVEGIAQEAKEVAEATGQHFWPDEQGVHVTEVTQDEWNDSTGTSYHSGANVLLNALGQLFRDGVNNLLSLTTGATYTETFQIRSDEDHYELTYHPMVVESVTIDGTATSDYTWTNSGHVVGSGKLGTLVLGYDTWTANPGATLSVTYRTSPAMTVWDGLGNLAANVMSYFTADEIGLGGNIFSDPHGTSRGAAVRFFGATDEQGASLTSGIQRDSAADYISYVDTIGLTGTTTDADAVSPNGCIADYGIKASGYLYDDHERSNDYRAESTAILYARSRSSDDYDAADARAQLGVKTVTIGDNYERSYVTLIDDFGSDADVPMPQALVGLTQPASSYTGANGTATASSNGWHITYFNTKIGETHINPVSSYWTFSNGVLTALRPCLLEFSGVMGWTDNVSGSRGFGLFVGATAPGSGTEHSAFQFFPSNVGTRKCVTFPPLLLPLSAGEHVAVGRYENSGAVYVNGANYSWITIRVIEDRSSN